MFLNGIPLRRFTPWQIPIWNYTGLWDDPALFVDMRLGKSLPVVRRIKTYRTDLHLITAPNSALYDWKQELQMEGETDICLLYGHREKRLKLLDEGHKWYLLNTEGWRWIPEICMTPWNVFIFDESTAIMNPKAQITKFHLKYFRQVEHKYILAGLPNPESALNYFCQLKFIESEPFGFKNYYEFRAKCFKPDWFGNNWKLTDKGKILVTNYLAKRTFILQDKDIPGIKGERYYKTSTACLPENLRQSYDTLERAFILEYNELFKKTKIAVTKYTWLRQLCGGFINNQQVHKIKIDLLKEALTQLRVGSQFVIFAEFTEEINLIAESLQYTGRIIDGETKVADRFAFLEEFRAGKYQMLIAENKALTYGANVSPASAAFFYSNPLGNLRRQQLEKRVILPTKENITLIWDLLIEDTVDVDIYEDLKYKHEDSTMISRLARTIMERVNLVYNS